MKRKKEMEKKKEEKKKIVKHSWKRWDENLLPMCVIKCTCIWNKNMYVTLQHEK